MLAAEYGSRDLRPYFHGPSLKSESTVQHTLCRSSSSVHCHFSITKVCMREEMVFKALSTLSMRKVPKGLRNSWC